MLGIKVNLHRSAALLSGYSKRIAANLAASIGLPPPIPITAFALISLAITTASSTSLCSGFGVILSYNTYLILLSFKAFSTTSQAPVFL